MRSSHWKLDGCLNRWGSSNTIEAFYLMSDLLWNSKIPFLIKHCQMKLTHMFPKTSFFYVYFCTFIMDILIQMWEAQWVKITSDKSFLQGGFCSEGAADLSMNMTIHSPLFHIQATFQIQQTLCTVFGKIHISWQTTNVSLNYLGTVFHFWLYGPESRNMWGYRDSQ